MADCLIGWVAVGWLAVLINWLAGWLAGWLACWFTGLLAGLVGLVGWLFINCSYVINWLAGWLTGLNFQSELPALWAKCYRKVTLCQLQLCIKLAGWLAGWMVGRLAGGWLLPAHNCEPGCAAI